MEDSQPIQLQDVALTTNAGEPVKYSPYGFIIDAQACVHTLLYRWRHGVITALLYPQLAEEKGFGVPVGAAREIDVFHYQNFEHEVANDLPIIRIATSAMLGGIYLSKGQLPASDAQIESVRLALAASGLTGSDTLTGEEGDLTVAQVLQELRQERLDALELANEPIQAPPFAGDASDKDGENVP